MSGHRAEVVFGVRLARHLGAYVIGSFVVLIISFVSVYVFTRLLGRAEFGTLSLLVFWASLLTLLFNLASMQGTLRSVFGSTGDDDVEDDDEDIDPETVRQAMGTGLILTVLICLAGMAIIWPISSQLSGWIIGNPDHGSWILLAAAAGAFGALLRLTSNVLRFERRPIPFVLANAARPLLILGPVIYLVERGDGVGGAIAGTAIGTGLAFVFVLALTRSTYSFTFSTETVKTIMRKGSIVIPVVISLWVVQNVDIFVLSRYVDHSDLAPYRVAAQFGLAVTYCTGAFFRAWTPLRRTTSFAALESQVGEGALRGAMVTYFILMCLTMLIGLTVASDTFALVAPKDYTNLPLLIPLVAGGFFAHGALVLIYRASQFKRKYNYYSAATMLSALGFFVGAVVLIPWLGTAGAALAVMFGFLVGMAMMLYFSQRGKKPIPMQYGSLAGAFALAGLCTVAARLLDAPAGRYQLLIATAAAMLFIALSIVTGVLPRGHQAPLRRVLRSLVRLRAGHIEPEEALAQLDPDDREILRLAVVHRRTPRQIADQTGRELQDVHAHLVSALRQLSSEFDESEYDSAIGQYLFYRETVAQQDALRKRLWSSGAEPEDVRHLEATLEVLDRAPREAWHPNGAAEEDTEAELAQR
jgi:O-antigen/teichoic acid export membrane protein